MRLVRPYKVTDAVLTSTNVPEADHPVWSAGTTYGLGAEVIITTAGTHRMYRSLAAGNIGNAPATSDTFWLDIGPTNRWALFDQSIGTATAKASSFYYEMTVSGRVDTLGLLNVQATSVRVECTAPGVGVVMDQMFNLVSTSGINNWYAYLFEEIVRLNYKTILDLPNYLNMTIKVTVTNTAGNASLGVLVLGRQKYIGRTQYGSSVGIADFSKKIEDDFGGFTIIERPYRKKGSFNIMVDNTLIDELQTLLASFRAIPILYLGTDEFESTSVYGFYKDFSLTIQYPTETQCNLEVEGLT